MKMVMGDSRWPRVVEMSSALPSVAKQAPSSSSATRTCGPNAALSECAVTMVSSDLSDSLGGGG